MAGTPESLQEVLFEKPIAGQSLTNAPDQRYPWESPPEFTSVKAAREKIFLDLLEPSRLKGVIDLMSNGIPVNAISQVVLKEGFNKGKFNPDMMLNLLEPTMFMLMAIAERAGIEPVIESDGSLEEGDETSPELVEESKSFIGKGGKFQDAKVRNIQEASVGPEIKKQLETLDTKKLTESILQKPTVEPRESLLEKGK